MILSARSTENEKIRVRDAGADANSGKVMSHRHLRRKLGADPAQPRHLLTEVGISYRFQPERLSRSF